MKNITAFRLELLTDPNLPLGGPGRSARGTCLLTEFEVEAAPADAADKPQKIKLVKATADIALPETAVSEDAKKKKDCRADRICHRRQRCDGLEHRRRTGTCETSHARPCSKWRRPYRTPGGPFSASI